MVNQVYKSPNRSGVCQGTIRINTQSTRCFFLAICPMRLDTLVFGTSFCIKRAQISLIKFHFSSTAGTMNLIISRADGTRTHREERRICTVGTILVASAASCLTRSSTHQRKAPRKTGLASRSGTFTSSRSTRKLISIPYRRHNTPSYGRSSKLNSIEPRRVVDCRRPSTWFSRFKLASEPPVSANKKDSSDVAVMKEIQEHLWPLFVEFNVDMVFWGHNHAYQRSCSLKSQLTETECALKSKTLSNGLNNVYEKPEYPISFIVGTGGANFTKNDVSMFFTEKVVHEHGFVDLHAHNATHVFGRFIDAVNGDRFLDSFWIIRENHSDDALKDNESHTAAIFFIVLVFLAP